MSNSLLSPPVLVVVATVIGENFRSLDATPFSYPTPNESPQEAQVLKVRTDPNLQSQHHRLRQLLRLQRRSRQQHRPNRNALAKKRRPGQPRVQLQVPPRRRNSRLVICSNPRVQLARRLPQRLLPRVLLPPLQQRAADTGWCGSTPRHTSITRKALA